MKIGIIDSGVDATHVKLHNAKITQYYVKLTENNPEIMEESPVDFVSHGTSCAGIIHKLVPEAEILSIRIFDKRLSAKEEAMSAAIRFCTEQQVDIVNCSIGIEKKPSPELYDACKKAYDKNIILVAAAANNSENETYPAFFPFVFGVASGLSKSNEWGYIKEGRINYVAKGTLQRVLDVRRKYNITGGTSMACPHLTSIIAHYIQENEDSNVNNIHNYLQKGASEDVYPIRIFSKASAEKKISNSYNFPKDLYPKERLNWMHKIAVFPVSDKEIESIIKFSHLSPFEIIHAIDYPRSLKREKYLREVKFGISDLDYSSFDTLVVGYFYKQLFEKNLSCGYELIINCLKKNINIFTLSPIFYEYLLEKKVELGSKSIIYTPKVSEDEYQMVMAHNHLPMCKTPIITVIGTGSKQGKLSTQLKIKKVLEDSGYTTAHVGTEPQSEILNSNFSFPIGYEGNVELTGDKKIKYLRNVTRILAYHCKPDIIISGIQGWTITRSTFSEADETTMVNFIYGIQPDAIVCAINPEDTLEVIKKNVDAAQLFSQSKCVFYVMTPFKRSYESGVTAKIRLNKEEYREKRIEFAEKLGLPVLDVFDHHNDQTILKLITDYFS